MSLKDVGMVTTDIMPSIQAESGPNDKAPYQMIKKKVEKYKGVRHTSILEKTIDDVTPRLPAENLFQIQANQKSNYQVNLPKVQLQEKDFDLKIHSSLRTKLMSVGVDSALNVSAPGMNETEKGSVEDVSPSRKSNQADSVR